MNIQDKSKSEYQARLNRVIDYIDMHLDQPLDLQIVANIAHFSPFHFHRIFTYLVGETPIDYIQRLRIERAAVKLWEGNLSITDIAYICGFNSVSLFSRTFRKYFQMTPTAFSKTEKPAYTQKGIRFRKNGQMLGKNMKIDMDENGDLCFVKSNQFIFMETKIEVKTLPDMQAIYSIFK